MKGHTDIPYAAQTAELISYPEKFIPDFTRSDLTFWARTVHFESRYISIDNLLENLPVNNILELSSGFSFRSLATVMKKNVYYIDTDLPDVVSEKKGLLSALKNENSTKGKLEFMPLNALDDIQFQKTIDLFPEGPIAIVNEGLLMYLNTAEKEKLCRTIYKVLIKRGGYWITADIYLKNKFEVLGLKVDERTQQFFEQHNMEENKFDSFSDAEIFFNRMGFSVEKEAKLERSHLSSIKYLIKNLTLKQAIKLRKAGVVQKTWLLKISDNK
jgi:O-methyltransferase involved in polyketide biosynthesis